MEDNERKRQITGIVTSVAIHLGLIALFLFVMGFTAPNPPLGELGSGVELQLGLDETGGGDIQQEIPITPTDDNDKQAKAEEGAQQPVVEETQPIVKEEAEQPKEQLSSDDEESPVVKEIKKDPPKKTEPVKEKVADKVVKPKEKPVVETKKTDVKESPNVETKVVKENGAKKDAGESAKNSKGISQGNDKGKTGDKGSPAGSLDPNGQYKGNPGTGGGTEGGGGISMSGFAGFERPKIVAPEVPEDSYGTYKFVVKVSSEGEIIKITSVTRASSLEAEKIFKKLIENLEFVPTTNLSASSEGTITFKIVQGKKK